MQNYYFCCIITGFKSVEVMKLKHNIKVKIMEVQYIYSLAKKYEVFHSKFSNNIFSRRNPKEY